MSEAIFLVSKANTFVSKAIIFVSEANKFVSQASKLSAGARIFRGPKGPEILVKYKGGIPN